MRKLEQIEDVIATDYWEYNSSKGDIVTCRVEVGRPVFVADGEWSCPVFIQGFTPTIMCASGVGPVDALMNAITLVRAFAEKIGSFSPGASKPQ